MAVVNIRRVRFLLWVLQELVEKYRRALVLGFLIGLGVAVVFWQVLPLVTELYLAPVERIGVVGEFTPSTLPVSIQEKMSQGLTSIGPDGTAQGALATRWESTDSGKLYTFFLTDKERWHNGKSVTAQDVNYNIRGVTFQVVAPLTLQARLSTPYSPFPVLLAKPIFQSGLRGFGPYRVAGIALNGDNVNFLKLVPVTDRALPTLEYRFYGTEELAILAYKHGDVDIVSDLSSEEALKNWGHSKITPRVNYQRIITVFFNLRHSALQEKSFRQGLAYAIPETAGERAYSPISKTSWAYTDEKVRHYNADAAQAKRLIDTTRVGTSSAQLILTTFSTYIDLAQSIANNWTKAGVPTTVRVTNAVTSDFDVLLSGLELPPDPDQYPFWHSTQTQTNITGYVNVKIDKLLEDGRQEQDIDKRKAIYADFARRLVEDAPAVFLYYPRTYTVERSQ